MLNKIGDPIFAMDDCSLLFGAIPGDRKRLAFSEGEHDDWPDELIDDSISYIQDKVTDSD